MSNLPMKAFEFKGYNDEFIKLTIDEIYGFPEETSYGGYYAKGLLEINIDGYSVRADHYFTTGELYEFLCQLRKNYDCLSGEACLTNVDRELELNLIFDKYGKIEITGEFQALPDKETKLIFEMTTDQTVILEVIQTLTNVYKNFGDSTGIENE